MDSISFITQNSNSFYKLELSTSLRKFIEYDFTYFWEQCIEFGIESKKSGKFDTEKFTVLKNLISQCHPYYEAKINSDYSHIVLDCIIEYICRTENIGLESLWSKYISPENAYQKTIFSRISSYKNHKAVNEWVNLVRLQKYAKSKTAYIYDGKKCSVAECSLRMKYFDLCYSVCSTELGYPSDMLPSVQRFSLAQMPNAVFVLSKASRQIYKRLEMRLEKAPESKKMRLNDALIDSNILDSFEYMKDLGRPEELEMYSASESFRFMPDVVYMPNCFKAIIDFEFTLMLDKGIMLTKCEKCGRYFVPEEGYAGNLCDRVGKNGKTCREIDDEERKAAQEDEDTQENVVVHDKYEEVLGEKLSEKSNEVYNSMIKQVGSAMPENEFNEWSDYLTKLKDNIKKHNSTTEELESFLDYTQKMYGQIKDE